MTTTRNKPARLEPQQPAGEAKAVERREDTPVCSEAATAEIKRLRDWIRAEGMHSDICTYDILHEICEGCRCKRRPISRQMP